MAPSKRSTMVLPRGRRRQVEGLAVPADALPLRRVAPGHKGFHPGGVGQAHGLPSPVVEGGRVGEGRVCARKAPAPVEGAVVRPGRLQGRWLLAGCSCGLLGGRGGSLGLSRLLSWRGHRVRTGGWCSLLFWRGLCSGRRGRFPSGHGRRCALVSDTWADAATPAHTSTLTTFRRSQNITSLLFDRRLSTVRDGQGRGASPASARCARQEAEPTVLRAKGYQRFGVFAAAPVLRQGWRGATRSHTRAVCRQAATKRALDASAFGCERTSELGVLRGFALGRGAGDHTGLVEREVVLRLRVCVGVVACLFGAAAMAQESTPPPAPAPAPLTPSDTPRADEGLPPRPGRFRVGRVFLTPYFTIGQIGVDANVFFTQTGTVRDVTASGGPGLKMVLPLGRSLTLTADGSLNYLWFARAGGPAAPHGQCRGSGRVGRAEVRPGRRDTLQQVVRAHRLRGGPTGGPNG